LKLIVPNGRGMIGKKKYSLVKAIKSFVQEGRLEKARLSQRTQEIMRSIMLRKLFL